MAAMMDKPHWRRVASRYVVDSRFLRIRQDTIELPDGTLVPEYFVREAAGFVMVFALTVDERVVLVRQYRYGTDSVGLELPAGMLEPGEDPEACARRELLEETGFSAESIQPLGEYAVEAVRSTAKAYIFTAAEARRTSEPHLDPTEHIEVELPSIAEFARMLEDGRIDNLASIAAGYRALAARTPVRCPKP
ncbi:MAG TPA: NUDIX hydrolase [Candidatus Dormibacteraeota bacterium]|nr:NUDIX hydrolase [Candidatus Dormibacteraeota bacterium]